jgi:hypothetical protein
MSIFSKKQSDLTVGESVVVAGIIAAVTLAVSMTPTIGRAVSKTRKEMKNKNND